MAKCVYLDHSATSWPKPEAVIKAINDALTTYGANPGRGAYTMALTAAREIHLARQTVCRFFNGASPERVVLTASNTEAINYSLYGLLESGDHVLYSPLEHNALWRPLMTLAEQGIEAEMIPPNDQGTITAADIEPLIRPNTKMVACVHASNVSGAIQPIAEIGKLTREKGIILLVDAAQSAGILPIDIQSMGIDLLTVPAHKGLYGPMGVGVLYVGEGADGIKPIKQGGTGSQSHNYHQPEALPDLLECGTLNLPGIAGLRAGIEWLERQGLANVRKTLGEKTQLLLEGLHKIPDLEIYGPALGVPRAPLVSVNLMGMAPSELAFILDKEYAIAVRAGFHCCSLGHKLMKTAEKGAVRFSLGTMTTKAELEYCLKTLGEIANSQG